MADAVTFLPGDPQNPRNWPRWRKWSIVMALLPVDLSVSWAASCYSPAETKAAKSLGMSSEVATLGLSLTVLGFALAPLALAPLSEYFGRSPIYMGSYGIFLLFILGTALVDNIPGFLILRFLAGLFCAVTIANFGGTIADLWPHNQTGTAMSLFLWAATCGSPSGVFLFSFVSQYRPWQDNFWALLGICGGLYIILCIVLRETRHTTILRARARRQMKETSTTRKEGGWNLTDAETEELLRHRSHRELFAIALTRPIRFLTTEAIVMCGALYNGYLYGISFLFNGAFTLVFGASGHGFDTLQVGLTFLGICIGITCGPLTNLWQERHYQRATKGDVRNNIPESRVQLGKVAAIAHPISLFWFSWTTYKSVPWIVPVLASALWGWSFYTLILMTYMYTEDSYGVYSASALAALGLIRNLAGAGFPLFGQQMFKNEGYQWAGSILAFLAIVMVPIPFIFEAFGPRLRARSPWASKHMSDDATENKARAEGD